MVEELKLAIKVDDDAIEQSLLKQFANAEKMANKVVLTFNNIDLDDKAIEAKFKEMQKMAGKNPIDLSIDKSSIEMLSAINKQLGNIFDIAKGKSLIDSSATVADVNKITNAINGLNSSLSKPNTSALQEEEKQIQKNIDSIKKLLDLKYEIKNVNKSFYSEKGNVDWVGIYKSQEEAISSDLSDNKEKLHSSLNLILSEDKNALSSLEEEATKLKTSLQSVQEMSNRISSNSSTSYLDKNKGSEEWYKGYAEAYKAIDDRLGELNNQYRLTNEELEEYITLQVKAEKIMDRMISHSGGVKVSGAKDKTELKSWIKKSFATDLGLNPEDMYRGLFGNITDALYYGNGISLFDSEGTKKSLREISSEILDYKSNISGLSGSFGANEDAEKLREINSILNYIKNNASEIESTDFSSQIKKASELVDYYSQKLSEGEHTDYYSKLLKDAQDDLQNLISLQERLNATKDKQTNEIITEQQSSSLVEQQNKIQEELKETQKQAEQTSESLSKIGDGNKSNISSLFKNDDSSLLETEKHINNIIDLLNELMSLSQKGTNGVLFGETGKAFNLSTLLQSKTFLSDMRGMLNVFGDEYENLLIDITNKSLDTFIHTHPETVASFSPDDLKSAFMLSDDNDKITKQLVATSNEISFLDIGKIKQSLDSNGLTEKFITEFERATNVAAESIYGVELQYKIKEILIDVLDKFNINADDVYKTSSYNDFANAVSNNTINSLPSARSSVSSFNQKQNSYDWIETVAKDDIDGITKLISEYEKIKNSISSLLQQYQNGTLSSMDEVDSLSKIRNRIEKQLKSFGYGNKEGALRDFSFEQAKQELEAVQKQAEKTSESLSKISDGNKSNISSENTVPLEQVKDSLKDIEQQAKETSEALNTVYHFSKIPFEKFDESRIGEHATAYGKGAYFFFNKDDAIQSVGEMQRVITEWTTDINKIYKDSLGLSEKEIKIIFEEYKDVILDSEKNMTYELFKSRVIPENGNTNFDWIEALTEEDINDVLSKLGYAGRTISGEKGFVLFDPANAKRANENITYLNQEIDSAKEATKSEYELAKARKEANSTGTPIKDVFQGGTTSAEKLEEEIKNIDSATENASESAKEYRKILSQVGEFDIDSKVSAMYKRNDGQLESWTWRAKKDDEGNVLYDQNGKIDYYEPTVTVISKYEQLEKIIVKADNELRNLQKDLAEIKAYDPTASTTNIEAKISDQKEYIQLLEQTVKVISQSDEYLLDEQQIIEARNKAAREYALTTGAKQEKTDAKQSASDEKKRLANIEQVNRALNKQQITIDAIEKTYNKTTNPDLDREVSNQQDLAELAQKKLAIQTKINLLQGQERNSANEKEFLELEKLIAEYKELAKYKLKANNPSKQELGGQNLQTLIQVQISNYDKLITKAEKYGDATSDTVEKLKEQRDILSKIGSDGKYSATADQYYASRDTYKVESAALSAFETKTKAAEQEAKAVQRLAEDRQQEKQSTQSSVDKALKDQVSAWKQIQSIREKIAKSNDANEIENLKKVKKEYQQSYIEADKILKTNSDLYDKEAQIAKLEQVRLETNKKIADYKNPDISSMESSLARFEESSEKLSLKPDNEHSFESWKLKIDELNNAINEYRNKITELQNKDGIIDKEDISEATELENRIKSLLREMQKTSSGDKGFEDISATKIAEQIHKLLEDNTAMSRKAKAEIQAYYDEVASGNPSRPLKEIYNDALKVVQAERAMGREGKSFLDTMKDKAWYGWAAQITSMFGVYDIINIFKQGANTLKEFDDGLTKISYTMDMTKSQLDNLGKSVLDMASGLDSSINNAMQVSQIYANMNTSAEEIKKLSEPTLILSNLTGFDASTVADDIQAVTQQFDIAAESSMHIADVYDQISRNISVDYSKGIESIAEAVQVAGSTADQAGLSFEQLAAIVGKTVEKTRLEGSQVGNGLKTIMTRLSKVGKLSEEVDNETLSQASESLKKVGIEVYNLDGSYREFDVIMGELANKWDTLSDAEKSNISFNIAA